MTLTDQMRERAAELRHHPVHTGEVFIVAPSGVWVDVADEETSGPHPYIAPTAPEIGSPCLVFDTAEGDRFVVAGFPVG